MAFCGELVGHEIGKQLKDAGVIPSDLEIRRIVIDISADSLVMVYYETYADKEMFDICVEELIKHKGKIKVKSVEDSK